MSYYTTSVDRSHLKPNLFRVVRKDEQNMFFGAKPKDGRWSKEEHKLFLEAVFDLGIDNWRRLEERIITRNNCQIRSHFQKYLNKICLRHKLKKTLIEVIVKPEIEHLINAKEKKIIKIFNEFKKNKIKRRRIKLERLKIRILKANRKKHKKKDVFIVKKFVDPHSKSKKYYKNSHEISQEQDSSIKIQNKLELHYQNDYNNSTEKYISTSNYSFDCGNNICKMNDDFSLEQNLKEHYKFILKLDFLKNFNINFLQNNFVNCYNFNFDENIKQFNEYLKTFESLETFSNSSNFINI